MKPTHEFLSEIATNLRRPDLPDGEISKTLAIRYLAPEILKLRGIGLQLGEIQALLEKEGLQVSRPLLMKTLRPASLLTEDHHD